MKPWGRGILCGIVGGFIGASLVIVFDPIGALLILAILLLTAGLYDLDHYYLEKGPQKYLKALDIN